MKFIKHLKNFRLVYSDPDWHLAIKTRLYSLNMNRLMYIYFIFYCEYISARIQILNHLRIKIIQQNEGNEQEVQKNLKKIKSFDLDIAKIIQLSREYFKWMLLLNLTGDVIYIIVDSYWIYGGFIFGNNPNFARVSQNVKTIFNLVHQIFSFNFRIVLVSMGQNSQHHCFVLFLQWDTNSTRQFSYRNVWMEIWIWKCHALKAKILFAAYSLLKILVWRQWIFLHKLWRSNWGKWQFFGSIIIRLIIWQHFHRWRKRLQFIWWAF